MLRAGDAVLDHLDLMEVRFDLTRFCPLLLNQEHECIAPDASELICHRRLTYDQGCVHRFHTVLSDDADGPYGFQIHLGRYRCRIISEQRRRQCTWDGLRFDGVVVSFEMIHVI